MSSQSLCSSSGFVCWEWMQQIFEHRERRRSDLLNKPPPKNWEELFIFSFHSLNDLLQVCVFLWQWTDLYIYSKLCPGLCSFQSLWPNMKSCCFFCTKCASAGSIEVCSLVVFMSSSNSHSLQWLLLLVFELVLCICISNMHIQTKCTCHPLNKLTSDAVSVLASA